jgi:hypothetical protein
MNRDLEASTYLQALTHQGKDSKLQEFSSKPISVWEKRVSLNINAINFSLNFLAPPS